ncbi:hypothetical protein SAMN05444920_1632 [Nonomuraea solani]|uniref:WXG100 family type VII secretion target n=1 Tax=Nonomuraea solani TaxID=1144553 RepID=A0A1H6F555_9ACTN|nr:hypothetical protein [Nonomuraea solani]SEH04124.1 hypothetical protein SAMN05444920_1632 [Nonomuraea solani]
MTIPSQSELLRQAAEKELLARTLLRYADELGNVFSGMLARPQGVDAFWKGPAAGRFTSQAAQLHREMGVLRESCTSTAERLRKQAQLARTEAAQLPS